MDDDLRTPDRTEVSVRPDHDRDSTVIPGLSAAELRFIHAAIGFVFLIWRGLKWCWTVSRRTEVLPSIISGIVTSVVTALLLRALLGGK